MQNLEQQGSQDHHGLHDDETGFLQGRPQDVGIGRLHLPQHEPSKDRGEEAENAEGEDDEECRLIALVDLQSTQEREGEQCQDERCQDVEWTKDVHDAIEVQFLQPRKVRDVVRVSLGEFAHRDGRDDGADDPGDRKNDAGREKDALHKEPGEQSSIEQEERQFRDVVDVSKEDMVEVHLNECALHHLWPRVSPIVRQELKIHEHGLLQGEEQNGYGECIVVIPKFGRAKLEPAVVA